MDPLRSHASYSESRVCSSLSRDVSLNNCTFSSDKMTQSQDSASWESLPCLPTCFINSFTQPQGHRATKGGCPSGKFMEFSFARTRIVHRSYLRHGIIGTACIGALPWESPADNDSSIFLHSLIEIIKQMGSALAFSGTGEQFLIVLTTYLLQTVDLVICWFSENQWHILSNLFLAELKAPGETGCLPTPSLPERFLFVIESQPPPENI